MLVREAMSEYCVDCDLTIANDGEAALRRIEELEAGGVPCPDLVILDLNLPRKSGYEVLANIRASEKWGRVPVIVLSSSDAPDDKARAVALGSTQYLSKPPAFDEYIRLGAVFRNILTALQ